MFRTTIALGIALIGFGLFGCAEANKPAPLPVKGSVTLDGKPLAEGEIAFCLFAQPPRVMPVKNGQFAGEALIGTNRIEVRAFKAGPPLTTDPTKEPTKVNIIPDRYNANSKLSADVVAGGAEDLKFAVTSR